MKHEIEARIAELKHRIDTYKKVAASDADIIKELLNNSNPEEIRFAADKAEAIARHIVRIPKMEAEIKKLQAKFNEEK